LALKKKTDRSVKDRDTIFVVTIVSLLCCFCCVLMLTMISCNCCCLWTLLSPLSLTLGGTLVRRNFDRSWSYYALSSSLTRSRSCARSSLSLSRFFLLSLLRSFSCSVGVVIVLVLVLSDTVCAIIGGFLQCRQVQRPRTCRLHDRFQRRQLQVQQQ
jgi:hypothetical protein